VPGGDEPPTRRDPAVTALPSSGSAVRAEAAPDTAWTPPYGVSAVGSGGDLDDLRGDRHGDDEITPPGGSRWTGTPTGPDRDESSWRARVDPDPAPLSRMAIEDIPLADVPLVEATLDSAPVEPQPELPRRRPSAGTRRRDAPARDGRGTRRRAPEEEVLSDWMSAEIAARPSGRHASPGHSDRPSGNDASDRPLTERRGAGRAASDDDPFHVDEPDDGRRGHRADDRTGRRRRRGRTGTDGRGAVSADDPMSLFRAPDDSGRHRR
ncbi:MAG: hypothetical protein M3235_02745, partial [Actinomycetota bacterium]|nr:hypothetical protein [Actinomycetota bacterium]